MFFFEKDEDSLLIKSSIAAGPVLCIVYIWSSEFESET